MERRDPFYAKVANVARLLTSEGFLLVSGGGPGAMEATHLGAYFASREKKDLDTAIEMLKQRPNGAEPGQEFKDKDWLHRAWRVMESFPIPTGCFDRCKSIGVPTWLYGHEPPAPFATHIAKYFANSVREDGLLAIANHGVIFAPGSAGTTQEVFQDAAQNHYGNQGVYSPMILFGEQHWTEVRPVWPLLSKVAKGKEYGELIALTDSEEEIVRRIRMFDPEIYRAK
jgi:predicted Rossmann-fold nucleotide-binding protein